MEKYQDPSFFNHAYQKYIAELNKDTSENDASTTAATYSNPSEDRDDA